MRHYVAVEDENGRWFYANEGQHRKTGEYGWAPSGACRECEGHDTAADAYEHEKQRLLDQQLRFHADSETAHTQHRCKAEGCTNFTSGSAWCGGYKHWSLCADHRNRETVERLLCVGESWES